MFVVDDFDWEHPIKHLRIQITYHRDGVKPFFFHIGWEWEEDGEIDDDETHMPAFEIWDGAHGIDGNEHFFWLPPMVTPAPSFEGIFDDAADPTVEVYKWNEVAGGWLATGISFFLGSGLESNALEEWYGAEWYVFDDPVENGDLFRVSVTASGQELGYADLLIVDKVTGQLRKTLGDQYVLMSEKNGKKFLYLAMGLHFLLNMIAVSVLGVTGDIWMSELASLIMVAAIFLIANRVNKEPVISLKQ